MTVGEQVITIFAGESGLLDNIPVKSISQFVTSLLQWLKKEHPDYIDEIDKTGKFTDELAKKLTAVIKNYKSLYKKGAA